METISQRDREILRKRAQLQLDCANAPENDVTLAKWRGQAAGRRESPPVRFLGSNFPHEVITPRLQGEGEQARGIECALLHTLTSRELLDDDTPISPTFDMALRVCEAASGCLFEIAQREIGTIFGDFERARHYVRLAKDAVDAYWSP